MKRYIAFLRGINVGGKNKIQMSCLKASFEEMGLQRKGTTADCRWLQQFLILEP